MKLRYEPVITEIDGEYAAVHRALMEKYTDSSEAEIGHALADFLNQLIREGLLIVP